MKKLLITLLLASAISHSQSATEVYLFDLTKNDSLSYNLSNPVNLSENKGLYDNQPSFLLDGSGVLFTSTRDDQTDIVLYKIEDKSKTWLTDTPSNEYSPTQAPLTKYFSAVRLDKDGTQLLWLYKFKKGKKPEILIKNLKVGYHTWFNKKMIVSFVLGEPPTLTATNLKVDVRYRLAKNIGRSIHKIPNTELISYIAYEHGDSEIHSIDPISSDEKYIADALEGSQDMAWLPDGSILMGKDDVLYRLKPGKEKEWKPMFSLKEFNLNGISRLAVSPTGNKIAIVVNESSEK